MSDDQTTIRARRVPARPRRGAWWRDNRLALGALLLLVPGVLLASGLNPWGESTSVPVIADDAGLVDVGAATWGPVKAIVLNDEDRAGLNTPPDSTVIAVKVPVAAHADVTGPVVCESPRLVERSTGRTWEQVNVELGVLYSRTEPVRCPADMSEFALIVAFAVPKDAKGPFWLDVPRYLYPAPFPRFPIDP